MGFNPKLIEAVINLIKLWLKPLIFFVRAHDLKVVAIKEKK